MMVGDVIRCNAIRSKRSRKAVDHGVGNIDTLNRECIKSLIM